ncbi:hypothetical protein [Leucobacter massiliensis]|uniref:Uncharacterized protein n=1 Tax=Leucobacter massiliensis TaxID=1686285 RepID=A0A2S9QPG0_9MICO|nr:hypothetical protein B4915_06505 [Leucobacter massiliensis]
MAVPRLTSRVVVAALAATLVMGGALPAIAVGEGDTANGYPSWDEVNAARASESAKAAELEKLQAALQRAQSESAAASTRAVQALLDSHQAEQSLAAAREREQQLSERLDADRRELEENSDTVARVVAWMYRDGTGLASTSQLILSDDPGDFMAKYGTATQVSGTWEALAARAAESVNAESDLEKQAATAREERQRLAAEARTAAEAAAEAQRAADAAVETASDNADTVTAQLASLRGTTAEVERQYQVGLQVAEQERAADAERQRQAEEARRRQQESGPGGGGPSLLHRLFYTSPGLGGGSRRAAREGATSGWAASTSTRPPRRPSPRGCCPRTAGATTSSHAWCRCGTASRAGGRMR